MLECFFCSEYMAADAAVQKYASHLNLDEWTVNIAMLNCFLTECLTSSNNRSDSDVQFALPKARSNSGNKMIKHSVKSGQEFIQKLQTKRVWHFF